MEALPLLDGHNLEALPLLEGQLVRAFLKKIKIEGEKILKIKFNISFLVQGG